MVAIEHFTGDIRFHVVGEILLPIPDAHFIIEPAETVTKHWCHVGDKILRDTLKEIYMMHLNMLKSHKIPL